MCRFRLPDVGKEKLARKPYTVIAPCSRGLKLGIGLAISDDQDAPLVGPPLVRPWPCQFRQRRSAQLSALLQFEGHERTSLSVNAKNWRKQISAVSRSSRWHGRMDADLMERGQRRKNDCCTKS
jgi:hypothetical protein